MRSLLLALAVAALFVTGCRHREADADAAVVARWRFRGVEELGKGDRVPALKATLGIPEAAPVKPRAATNLADQLVIRLTGATNGVLAAQLRPLVQAVAQYESAGEITAEGWSLAVQVPPAESAAVQSSVMALPPMAGQAAVQPQVRYTNGWLLAGSAAARLGRAASLPALGANGLLTGDFDLAVIGKVDPKKWPRVHLEFFATNGTVRTTGRLSFASAPAGDLPAWKIPDTLIHDPIIHFGAARGIESLLAGNPWFEVLSGGKVPDQLCMWSQPGALFRTWIAAPVDDGLARIPRIQTALDARVSTNAPVGQYVGVTLLSSNKSSIAVYNPTGPRGIMPTIGVARLKDQDFLMASVLRPARSTNPVPAELLGELNKPDLVYYDWELTGEAYLQWNVLVQYNKLVRGLRANALLPRSHTWMLAAAPKFGNAVTTVRRVSPTEFALDRSSSAGLTSLEWIMLTRFLDGPIVELRGMALPPGFGVPVRR